MKWSIIFYGLKDEWFCSGIKKYQNLALKCKRFSYCHSSTIISRIQPEDTLERIQGITFYFNFQIVCLQNCNNWVGRLVIMLSLLIIIYYYYYYNYNYYIITYLYTIGTIASYNCKLPGFFRYSRVFKAFVFFLLLNFFGILTASINLEHKGT